MKNKVENVYIPPNQRIGKVWLIRCKNTGQVCHFQDSRELSFNRYKKDLEINYPKDKYYFQQVWLGFQSVEIL